MNMRLHTDTVQVDTGTRADTNAISEELLSFGLYLYSESFNFWRLHRLSFKNASFSKLRGVPNSISKLSCGWSGYFCLEENSHMYVLWQKMVRCFHARWTMVSQLFLQSRPFSLKCERVDCNAWAFSQDRFSDRTSENKWASGRDWNDPSLGLASPK